MRPQELETASCGSVLGAGSPLPACGKGLLSAAPACGDNWTGGCLFQAQRRLAFVDQAVEVLQAEVRRGPTG